MLPLNLMNMTITVYSTSAGSRDANDRWVEGTETPATHTMTSVQPASGKVLKTLPEGERTDSMISIYDAEELKVADPVAGTVADVVLYNGARYKVIRVKKWNVGLLDHYHAIADREHQ